MDAQWLALVVVPLEEVERWAPVLGRLGDGPTAVPVLGMASRDASVDVTPALALGVTDLLTLTPATARTCSTGSSPSMRGAARAVARTGPSPPRRWPSLRAVTEAAEEAAAHRDGGGQGQPGRGARAPARQARESLSHSLQVILAR